MTWLNALTTELNTLGGKALEGFTYQASTPLNRMTP